MHPPAVKAGYSSHDIQKSPSWPRKKGKNASMANRNPPDQENPPDTRPSTLERFLTNLFQDRLLTETASPSPSPGCRPLRRGRSARSPGAGSAKASFLPLPLYSRHYGFRSYLRRSPGFRPASSLGSRRGSRRTRCRPAPGRTTTKTTTRVAGPSCPADLPAR